jgi:hypothetical protein
MRRSFLCHIEHRNALIGAKGVTHERDAKNVSSFDDAGNQVKENDKY